MAIGIYNHRCFHQGLTKDCFCEFPETCLKLEWYELNGFSEQLITSKDGPDASIDATEIERTARERVLQE